MKMSFIALRIKDLEETLEFYKEVLEFKVIKRFSTDLGELAYVCNDKIIAPDFVFIESKFKECLDPKGMVFGFTTNESLPDCRQRINNLGIKVGPVLNNILHYPYFEVKDPNGLVLQIFN